MNVVVIDVSSNQNPWLFAVYRGLYILHSDMGITINHDKDPSLKNLV